MESKYPELCRDYTIVQSQGVVEQGRIVGDYDFYDYLRSFEGKSVKWTLEKIP